MKLALSLEKKTEIWYNDLMKRLLLTLITLAPTLAWAQTNVRGETTLWDRLGIFGDLLQWSGLLFAFALSIVLAFFVAKYVASRVRKKNKYQVHQEVLLLIERSVFFGVIVVCASIALALLGVDLTWVLGPLSVGLGFALKDVLGNIIAGVVILSQQKFKIGDIIRMGEHFGKIVNIDMRTTDVQTFDGLNLVIPNYDMLTNVIKNYTSNTFRRITVEVGVHYSTNLAMAIETATNAVKSNKLVVSEPNPEVIAREFSDSAILLEVRFWIESTHRWWQIQSEVIQQVKSAFDQVGITIPFPIRTISLDSHDQNLLKSLHIDTKNPNNPSAVGDGRTQ